MTRTVLVTGAASGIGEAVTRRLVDAGDRVVGWDLRTGDVDGAAYDIVDLADAGAICAATARLPERIDAVANVAGVPGTFEATDVLRVNVLGPRRVVDAIRDRLGRGAAVVNVASLAADRNTVDERGLAALRVVTTDAEVGAWLGEWPLDGPAAYDTSKRTLVDYSTLLAQELLPHGVRVVVVSPGPIETPILPDFERSMGKESLARSSSAVGRHGSADEVAAVIVFALSAGASWLNGVEIRVDGGLTGLRAAARLRAQEEGAS